MTSEQKKERRQAKHEVFKKAKRHAVTRLGLYSTGGQIRSAAKILTERFIAAAREQQRKIPSTT